MYVGYALIRTDEDLRKFLVVNLVLAGRDFVDCDHSGDRGPFLSQSHESRAGTSRTGRAGSFLADYQPDALAAHRRIREFGAIGVVLGDGHHPDARRRWIFAALHRKRPTNLVFVVLTLLVGGTLFSGSRGAVAYGCITALVLSAGFLWGAPWRWRQAHRLVKAIRTTAIALCLGLALIFLLFPSEIAPRIAFYMETLNPNSSAYEVSSRAWDYPIKQSCSAPSTIRIGWSATASVPPPSAGNTSPNSSVPARSTSGWKKDTACMIIEMGILAPFLWIIWSGALVYSSWGVVRAIAPDALFSHCLRILLVHVYAVCSR